MKKQNKSNLQISMQSLGMIFLIFFAMAFACKDDTKTDTRDKRITTSSGGCSTEREFKDVLTKSWSQTFSHTKAEFKEMDVEFYSFKIGQPFRDLVKYPTTADTPAYPVTTSFTTRHFLDNGGLGRKTQESRAVDNKYVFYIDAHGDCEFSLVKNNAEIKQVPYEE